MGHLSDFAYVLAKEHFSNATSTYFHVLYRHLETCNDEDSWSYRDDSGHEWERVLQ